MKITNQNIAFQGDLVNKVGKRVVNKKTLVFVEEQARNLPEGELVLEHIRSTVPLKIKPSNLKEFIDKARGKGLNLDTFKMTFNPVDKSVSKIPVIAEKQSSGHSKNGIEHALKSALGDINQKLEEKNFFYIG